jgi:hypothetical protein
MTLLHMFKDDFAVNDGKHPRAVSRGFLCRVGGRHLAL